MVCACGAAPTPDWPEAQPLGVGPAGALVAVDGHTDRATVIDVERFQVVGSRSLGLQPFDAEWPLGLAPSASGDLWWVALANVLPGGDPTAHHGGERAGPLEVIPGFLVELDVLSGRKRTVQVDPGPLVVKASPDGAVHVGHFDPDQGAIGRVTTIRAGPIITKTRSVCAGIADLEALPDGRLAAACSGSDQIAIFDPEGDDLETVAVRARPLRIASDGLDGLWYASRQAEVVGLIRAPGEGSAEALEEHDVHGEARDLALLADGGIVAAVQGEGGAVRILGGPSFDLPAGDCAQIRDVLGDPRDPSIAYVMCAKTGDGGSVLRIDLNDGRVAGAVTVSPDATTLEWTPAPPGP